MSNIFKRLIPSLIALSLFATPSVFADEESKAPSEAQAKSAIKKLATGYIAARKQLVCSQCVGKIRIPCTTCKGKAWKFQDNRYKRGGVDWERSTPCPKCNKEGKRPAAAYARKVRKRGTEPRNAPGAGTIDCPKNFCTLGFNKKAAKKIFWDLRSPSYQKNMSEGLKGLNTDDIVELILVTINDNAKEMKVAKIKEIAGKTGINPQSIAKLLQENVNLKHNWIRPANTGKLVSHSEGNAEVEMRHYKSKERFNETVPVIWENNKAYLGIPKKKTSEEGSNEGGMKDGQGKEGE
ncbi:MAG: hypothetical protein P1V97_18530, partial [Planctomycetota bacterium]|nr:hypothetical protein [Planctomycetota bacterium]